MEVTKKLYIGIIGARSRNSTKDFELILDKFMEIVVGSSNYTLSGFYPELNNVGIISGGCLKGGDRFAKLIYEYFIDIQPGLEYIEYAPQLPTKNVSKQEYRKAAYKRNTLIAKYSDVLIACVSPERKGGTGDTIEKFKKIHNYTRKLIIV